MTNGWRINRWIILALAALPAVTGCAAASGPKTPEEAFQEYRTALSAADFGRAYDLATTEGQNQMMMGSVIGLALAGTNSESRAESDAIVAKYGVDKAIKSDKPMTRQEAEAKLAAAVRNKREFVVESLTWLNKKQPHELTYLGPLSNLKIEGDRAEGQAPRGAPPKPGRVYFRKVGGIWKIDAAPGQGS